MIASLTLDTILSAMFFFSAKWSSDLQSNKARDVLRFLVIRLYNQGRGQLVNAQLTLAQTTLARKLRLSPQWVCILTQRLEQAGWIEHYSQTLPDGTNGSTIWRIGRTLKRMLVMLSKSSRGKSSIKKPFKRAFIFSPSAEAKEKKRLNQLQKPVNPGFWRRSPIAKTWLSRGDHP